MTKKRNLVNNMAAFVRAVKTSLNISTYYLTLSKAKQRFRAEGILMPHLLRSPNVSCKATTITMRDVLDKKLDKISDICNNYIWEYKFCNSKIKFTPDVKSNYFGDILIYFSDTFNLIYNVSPPPTPSFLTQVCSIILR